MKRLLFKRTALVLLGGVMSTLTLSTCSDTATGPGIDPGFDTLPDTSVSVKVFPNSRNDLWVYEIYDSLAATVIDTVTITIRGELSVPPGDLARVWETHHSATDSTDSTFVRIASDSVHFFPTRTFSFGHEMFHLPLFADKRWKNPGLLGSDSGGVLVFDSISVPAGDFPLAARVLNGWQRDFKTSGNLRTSWVVDSIGIVQRQDLSKVIFNADTTITGNTVWRLLLSNLIVAP